MGGRGALAARPPDSKPNGSKVAPAQRAIARRSRRALLPSGLDGEDERDDPYEEVRSTQAAAGEGEEMKLHHIRGCLACGVDWCAKVAQGECVNFVPDDGTYVLGAVISKRSDVTIWRARRPTA